MINDIMLKLDDIQYGYKDKDNNVHYNVDNKFAQNYSLQSPEEVLKNKVGVCWDQVELERVLFLEKKISVNTYFIVHYDGDKCPTHTFLIYKLGEYFYWFEHSWELFRGIHKYDSELEALKDIRDKFIKYELHNQYEPMNLCIYNYDKPKYELSCLQFYKHCEKGTNIKI